MSQTLEISIEARDTNVELVADPDRTVQVLVNLMSNAMKFSPTGDTILIESIEDEFEVEV